jgi:hypothetical protein
MRFPPARVFLIVVLAAVAAVTACSSSGSAKPGASASTPAASPTSAAPTTAAPTTTPTTAPSGGAASATAAQIKTNWETFFNPKTPVAQRVNLLQNGSTFASIIQAQAGSPLASSATSSVTAVTVESATQAKVTYSILVAGTPALKNQPGVSVYQNGTWKVGDQSFCALLTLENSGKAPSVCASAAS